MIFFLNSNIILLYVCKITPFQVFIDRKAKTIKFLDLIFITAFIRAIIFKRGTLKRGIFKNFVCDMHSLMPVRFLMYSFMNDFLPGCLLLL